jgi:hypothetical protein
MGRKDLHDVPKDRLTPNFYHGLRTGTCFFA